MKHKYFFGFTCILTLAFSAGAAAQDASSSEDNIKKIADKACECTKDISIRISKDSIVQSINGCIYAAVMEDQVTSADSKMKQMLDTALAAKNDTVVGSGETVTIVVDKDFDKIQRHMHNNCARVKTLMGTDNISRDKSMSKDPKALEFYNQGIDFSMHEQYEKAIESYRKAVKADPKFAFAWDNLGICYRRTGKYKEAINCYKKSHDIDPLGTTPLMNMGVAYMLLQDYKSAAAAYDKLIELDPEDAEGYYGAGKAYFLCNDYEKGLDNIFKAYRIYDQTKSPYVNDAGKIIEMFYADLNAKGKKDIFDKVAKNNNIEIK